MFGCTKNILQDCCMSDNDDIKQVELTCYKWISQGKSSSPKGD